MRPMMTDHSESAALEPPAEDPTGLLDARDPASIREAFDLHVRLDALGSWVDDRKRDVRRWVAERADLRRDEDGAAATWRLGDDVGTVLQTDPKPTPRITDREMFAEWYVREVLADNPDREGHRIEFDPDVVRVTVATCPSPALLTFVDGLAEVRTRADTPSSLEGQSFPYADDLVDAIEVDVEWFVSDDLLERLLDGKIHTDTDGKPRLKVTEVKDPGGEWVVFDRETGEIVPGTTVAPPGTRTVQVKPKSALKESVRAELDALIGPAKLGQEGND